MFVLFRVEPWARPAPTTSRTLETQRCPGIRGLGFRVLKGVGFRLNN